LQPEQQQKQNDTATATTTTTTTAASPSKSGKFAAMVHSRSSAESVNNNVSKEDLQPEQQQTQNDTATATATTASTSKSGKFAAMAHSRYSAESVNNNLLKEDLQPEQQQKQNDTAATAATATATAASPSKSGKFAAMASQDNNNNNNNDGSSDNNIVKIDLQQQEQQRDGTSSDTVMTTTTTTTEQQEQQRDGTPSDTVMTTTTTAEHQEQQRDGTPSDIVMTTTTTVATTAPLSPRRDKLAAITARSSSDPSTTTTTTNPTNIPENQSAQPPRRNDKFSAMAGRNTVGDGEGNSVVATATVKAKTDEEKAAEAVIEKQKYLTKLKERLLKRRAILNSLDRAEELTCNLLKIAAKTAVALQDLNYSPDLTELSVSYRSTLQELHPLLTMGTEELIKPYQNHTKETKQSMYAARVEMRLAKERLEVLKTFTELEKEDSSSNKKQQQQQQATANNNDADTVIENHYDESDRKRKR
jgi:hypothetical protein